MVGSFLFYLDKVLKDTHVVRLRDSDREGVTQATNLKRNELFVDFW